MNKFIAVLVLVAFFGVVYFATAKVMGYGVAAIIWIGSAIVSTLVLYSINTLFKE